MCVCACVRKRINFSRAFMLSDRPNCAHTHTHIYTRFQTRRWFGCSTPARRFDVSTCAGTSRNTHTLRNVRGRGVRMYVRTVAKIRFDHAAYGTRTCRRKIITTSEISKYTYAKCAPGEPYNTMIKHGRKGDPRNRFSIPSKRRRIFSFSSLLLLLEKLFIF